MKIVAFHDRPKFHHAFGLLLIETMSPWTFKNRPILSYCLRYTSLTLCLSVSFSLFHCLKLYFLNPHSLFVCLSFMASFFLLYPQSFFLSLSFMASFFLLYPHSFFLLSFMASFSHYILTLSIFLCPLWPHSFCSILTLSFVVLYGLILSALSSLFLSLSFMATFFLLLPLPI